MSNAYEPVPLDFAERPPEEMQARAEDFLRLMQRRRSVRDFSDRPVPRGLVERAIRVAGTAPSGAHRQPWRFVAVDDPELKREIREAAEAEERESYEGRMSEEWLEALAPLGTGWRKPFLETAPWLVVCFAESYGLKAGEEGNAEDGSGKSNAERTKNYYVQESCGIACGFFIAALHHMGLATLTHTPSPMRFLSEILGRPRNERPYILFPVGYPAEGAEVPALERKPLSEIVQWNRGEAAGRDDGGG